MPSPTIFRKDSTLVWELSIIFFLNVLNDFQPAPPASTIVVTPTRKVKPSGGRATRPLLR
jgi:hypothetical protein